MLESLENGDGWFICAGLLFVFWSASVLVLAILATVVKAQARRDLELARNILEAGTMQADELSKMMEASRILRHDCKHHLHVAQMLLETDQIQEARAYLLNFGIKCDEGALPQFCENPAVNALLLFYHHKCRAAGIDFSAVMALPDQLNMDSFELCILLGNLMENALEACQKASKGSRQIILRGIPQGGQLLITVKNTFDGVVIEEEGHIVSRKGTAGGLGIKSIRDIAVKHKGEYVSRWDDHTYTASVILRL